MFTTFFSGALKALISGSMAMTMALTSSLTGPAGDYADLQNKAMEITPAQEEITLELQVDMEALASLMGEDLGEIPEIPGIYEDGKIDVSAKIYAFSDMDEYRAVISLGDDPAASPSIYVDTVGVALNAPAVETVLTIMEAFTDETSGSYEVYKKYFDGEGMYFTWVEILELGDVQLSEEEAALANGIIEDVLAIFTSEESLNALADVYAPVLKLVDGYYTETTVDGTKAYTCKITGAELMKYIADVIEISGSEEMAEGMFNYIVTLARGIDYVKYIDIINSFLPEESKIELPAGVSNEMIAMIVEAYLVSEFKDDFIAAYTEQSGAEYQTVIAVLEVLASGEDAEDITGLGEMLPVISGFLDKSYEESVIYEKNGVITETSKIVIADAKAEYISLSFTNEVSKYDGTVMAAADVVPFDKRVEMVEIDNKMGYEAAVEKGVHSIDISWNAVMYPEDSELIILNPYFYINYNSSMIESIKNDPAFAQLDKETQELLLGMYDESDHEYKTCDSTAHLVDNSVYLPLRQIMENAGYEVSWDAEARKAYVTVNGTKVEMTGVIINDRTYVKIRDFEKLGAKVEYEEEFYYEDAYNDFDKECYVTITFAK